MRPLDDMANGWILLASGVVKPVHSEGTTEVSEEENEMDALLGIADERKGEYNALFFGPQPLDRIKIGPIIQWEISWDVSHPHKTFILIRTEVAFYRLGSPLPEFFEVC